MSPSYAPFRSLQQRQARTLGCSLLTAAAVFALSVPGCSSKDSPTLRTSCAQNSDCSKPYICAIGKCRSRCVTAEDCDGGSCIIDEKRQPVCQPATEKNSPCNYQGDCSPPLACATDYRCRNLCGKDSDCNYQGVTGRACVTDGNGILFCADLPETTAGVLTTEAARGHGREQVSPPTMSGGGSSGAADDAGSGGESAAGDGGTSDGGSQGGSSGRGDSTGRGGGQSRGGSPGAGGKSLGAEEQVGANADLCPPPGQTTSHKDVTISADATWESVHDISGTLTVRALLKLSPCAVVRFNSGAGIRVDSGGSLQAIGTEGKAVTFTSAKAAPAAGDWAQIVIVDSASNDSRFEQAVVEYGGSDMVKLDQGAAASFSSVTLRESEEDAMVLWPAVSVSEFENVRFERAGAYPLALQMEDAHVIGSMSSTGSKNQAIMLGSNKPLTTPATWRDHGVPYAFRDTTYLTYVVKAELTLDAGVTLLMAGHSLSVEAGGALLTTGTEARPVTFTSGSAMPKAGDWGNIAFLGTAASNSLLDYAVVEYASDSAIAAKDKSALGLSNVLVRHVSGNGIGGWPGTKFTKFENVTVEDTAGYPLNVQLSTLGDLGSLSATGGNPNQIAVLSYDAVTRAATWKNFGLPYHFVDTTYLNLNLNAPVTLEAGTTLMLDSGKSIAIGAGGSLKAQGTEQKPITISSSLAVPAPNGWGKITVAATAAGDSTLTWTTVKDGALGALTLNGSQFALDHATFIGNLTCDVKVSAGTLLTSAGGNSFMACP